MASILVVCTGNVCRSPIAEGVLRRELQRRFGDDPPVVASAGIAGWEGSPAMAEAVAVAAEMGVDIAGHVARRLAPEHVRAADLSIAMAAEHRDAIVAAVPEAVGRTFTLKELVRLLETLPPGDPHVVGSWTLRVDQANDLRRKGARLYPGDEDVVDPLGLPIESYRAVASDLDEWCARLVEGLSGAAAVGSPTGDPGAV